MPNDFEKERTKLKQALDELVALNQIANAINALMSVEAITQVIIDHCLKKINASQGAVFLLDEQDKQIDKFKTFVREFSATTDKVPFHINESLTGWMIKNRTMFASNDPDHDDRFKWMHLSEVGIESILAAPLFSRRGLIGSLILFNKKDPDGFTENDKRFLGIVGSQTAKVIENAKLREQEEKLVAIQEELKVAKSIQQGFLPDRNISTSVFEICGFNTPANDMGGDYYDMVQIDQQRVFLSLGDVSGKGVPAALLMANAQAVLRSQLPATEDIPLANLARSLNHLICQFTNPEQFITAVFGVFDSTDKSFHYVNAGHEPPVVVRSNGTIETLEISDLVIGVLPDYNYTEKKVILGEKDLLLIYTDGVTEAFNKNGEQFGEERFTELLKSCVGDDAASIGEKVMSVLGSFRGDGVQTDDITMLILRLY